MTVTLCPITDKNWVECLDLEVTEVQQEEGYVSSNAFSLAQAHYEPWWQPLGVYVEDAMIGFVMHGRWPDSDPPVHHVDAEPGMDCILRVMIDQRYQGKGYGQAAMAALVERIKAQPDCRAIEICYEPSNAVAEHVYAKCGFRHTGKMVDGEAQMILHVAEMA